jgi:pyruvate kinase
MTKLACELALAGDFGKPGDNIVIIAGIPFGVSGTTNLLRVATLSQPPALQGAQLSRETAREIHS